MNYTEDARYYQFLIETAIENEKINGFIKTITLSESASPKKLWAVHEDVGDKIRSLWDKFIAFLNRVWAKFVEFSQKIINSDKGYLEQYKDTILNQKPKDVTIEMRDYPTGIHRMTSNIIPPFNTEQEKIPVDDSDISFKTVLIPEYKDASKDFAGFAVAYFQGGEEKKSTNMTNLNMTDLYNFCHDFDKIQVALQKDKDTLTKTFNDTQGAIQKAKTDAQSAQQTQQQAQVNANQTNAQTPPAQQKPAPQQTQQQPKPNQGLPTGNQQVSHASYSLGNYLGSYFNEDDANGGMTIGKPNPNAAQNTAATGGDSKASSNMKSVQTSPTPAAQPDAGVDLDTLTKKVANYNSAASSVLTAKMTSAHVIYNDYMKLIKLHVGSYVGQEGDSQVAQSGSNYKGALKIDNPQDVLNTIATIDASKDANEKSKLTADLNNKVKASNPNFQGGLDAIKAAATAALPKK